MSIPAVPVGFSMAVPTVPDNVFCFGSSVVFDNNDRSVSPDINSLTLAPEVDMPSITEGSVSPCAHGATHRLAVASRMQNVLRISNPRLLLKKMKR